MRKAALWFGISLLVLMVIAQFVTLGLQEGWWAVVFAICFIVALFGSLIYGLSGDE